MGKKMKTNNQGQGVIFRPKQRINRKTKINLVFDADARKEFLTGFHKRKLQRKKKAQDELKEQLKAERKRIKEEARNLHKTLVVSHRPIPELEDILAEEETYEFDEHSVSVREISTSEMADENCWIGENKTQYEEKPEPQDGDATSTLPANKLRTGKEVKKAVKKLATKQVRKSKVFKKKGKIEQTKNRKKSRVKKMKLNSKRNKHNHPNKRPHQDM